MEVRQRQNIFLTKQVSAVQPSTQSSLTPDTKARPQTTRKKIFSCLDSSLNTPIVLNMETTALPLKEVEAMHKVHFANEPVILDITSRRTIMAPGYRKSILKHKSLHTFPRKKNRNVVKIEVQREIDLRNLPRPSSSSKQM